MSFAEIRIEEYLISKASKDQHCTEVPFAETRIGDLETVIVANDQRLAEAHDVSEEEIERQLAREGLIRPPAANGRVRNDFKPIDVTGKPVSEMIIEERR